MKTVGELSDLLATDLGIAPQALRDFIDDKVDMSVEATARDATALVLAGLVQSVGGRVGDVSMLANLPHTATHCYRPGGTGMHGEVLTDELELEAAFRRLKNAAGLLTDYADLYVERPEMWLLPVGLEIRLSKGRPMVELNFRIATEGDPQAVRLAVRYSMLSLGGDVRPDDAPLAEIERTARVSGAIFDRIREYVAGMPPPDEMVVDPPTVPEGVTLQ